MVKDSLQFVCLFVYILDLQTIFSEYTELRVKNNIKTFKNSTNN